MLFEINEEQMEKLFKLDNHLIYEIFGKEEVNILLKNPFMLKRFDPKKIYIAISEDVNRVYKLCRVSYNPNELDTESDVYAFQDLSLSNNIALLNKESFKGTAVQILDLVSQDKDFSLHIFNNELNFARWYNRFIEEKYKVGENQKSKELLPKPSYLS